MAHTNPFFDVAIIGGGLSGLSLACLLDEAGLNVACIDRQTPQEALKSDLRTTAISYGSRQILEPTGIWKDLDERACPIRDIQILDGHSPVLLDFLSEDVEGKSFGWIVLNADLRKSLMKQVAVRKNITYMAPCSIKDFSVGADGAQIILEDGKVLETALIVGADGRGSFVRQWMGVKTRGWSYKQRAIICVVEHENPHHNRAVEHFWPEGPFAILPMSDDKNGHHRSSVVFTEHGPESQSLMSYSDTVFETALTARFPENYGALKLLGKRACYPLGLVHAGEYTSPRMALVADAAHGIHPIAGQGLNLGFRDVAALSKLLASARSRSADLGSAELLEQYESQRRLDNMSMVAMTDALVRLFSNNIPPVRSIRRAGLKMVSKMPAARRFFMRKAMGE